MACQPVKRLLIFVTWCVFGGEKKAKNRKLLAMYWDNIVMFGCDETNVMLSVKTQIESEKVNQHLDRNNSIKYRLCLFVYF